MLFQEDLMIQLYSQNLKSFYIKLSSILFHLQTCYVALYGSKPVKSRNRESLRKKITFLFFGYGTDKTYLDEDFHKNYIIRN